MSINHSYQKICANNGQKNCNHNVSEYANFKKEFIGNLLELKRDLAFNDSWQ